MHQTPILPDFVPLPQDLHALAEDGKAVATIHMSLVSNRSATFKYTLWG